MNSSRDTALELLMRIESGGAYGDRILSSPLVLRHEPRDRSFIRELVNGVMRWKLRLDRTIDMYYTKRPGSLSPSIRMILRLGLYQLMFVNSVPAHAAVHESVEAARRLQGSGAGGLVNALLRRFTREGESPEWPDDPAERLSQKHSYPLWLARRWIDCFGSETASEIMRAGNNRHVVSLRTNSLRTTASELMRLLSGEGFEAVEGGEIPGYLLLSEAEGLFESESFRKGLFTAQDQSAAMAPLMLAPLPGEIVLDLCAAPGGKTTFLAEMTGDSGRIVAVDANPGRCGIIRDSAGRLGLTSIEVVEGDAVVYCPVNGELFDRVLLDAPCMGTAVLSKRPDMKWRRSEPDVARLAELQRTLLDNAAKLVKPGGILVYSTCSLEPEENSGLIGAFLGDHPDFLPETGMSWSGWPVAYGCLILPHRMHGTGAYAVKMRYVPGGVEA
jgi:16S rRNA (cytosine967-C5)-methyltransferase